jgi:AcrR family transcriptional regulator
MEAKERIKERAGELFSSIGIKNLTMDALALDLGISKRTIYEHFKDKDDLVIQVIEHQIITNNQVFLEIISKAGDVIEALFLIIRQEHERFRNINPVYKEDLKKYFPRINECFYQDNEKLKEFSASYTLLEKGKSDGVFRSDLNIEIADNFLHELIIFLHNSERIRLMNLKEEAVLEFIILPYFRGICTRKGQELMERYFNQVEP